MKHNIIKILFLIVGIGYFSNVFSQASTITFNYTGAMQTWTVPPCVFTINVIVAGAKGGGANGGSGARISATLNVTPGQILNIYCGGMGTQGNASGGWNGGGTGFASNNGNIAYSSWGGGGASDIRIGGTALANRVIVGGGGGGRSGGSSPVCGGAANCNNGAAGCNTYGQGGQGGTQVAGGAGGTPWAGTPPGGSPGTLGNGGQAGLWQTASGGGGGGGYYGGGGGGNDGCCTGANGGGGGGAVSKQFGLVVCHAHVCTHCGTIGIHSHFAGGQFSHPTGCFGDRLVHIGFALGLQCSRPLFVVVFGSAGTSCDHSHNG